jgi:hypothetical protein
MSSAVERLASGTDPDFSAPFADVRFSVPGLIGSRDTLPSLVF